MASEVVGRFAPSPTGRMHLGNIYAALLSWLSAKRQGGKWILRIEDIDPGRSRLEYAKLIEDDLHWLGLDWDEGGLDNIGPNGPYLQSQRSEIYEHYLEVLKAKGLVYACECRRSDLLAASAPHQSDGRVIYSGRCRPAAMPCQFQQPTARAALRLWTANEHITFRDRFCGEQTVDLARDCGDFVVKRSDGAWAYQLAVVVDDALMGVTEVVRGADLLLSAAQQIYLFNQLGFPAPLYAHFPLLNNDQGQRLSKRDGALAMDVLRSQYTPDELIGLLAFKANLIPEPTPIALNQLLATDLRF